MTNFKVNETYILKKDLPHIKAGTEFLVKDCYNSNELFLTAICQESFKISDIVNFNEWFEKKEEFWMPAYDEKYAYLDFINVLLREEFYIHERLNIDHDIDKFNFSIGNVFRTKLGAETCRDYFMKPAFKKYHKMQKSEGAG